MLCLLFDISDFGFWISDLGMEINTTSNLISEISKRHNLTDLTTGTIILYFHQLH
jgi:hypothetical protein